MAPRRAIDNQATDRKIDGACIQTFAVKSARGYNRVGTDLSMLATIRYSTSGRWGSAFHSSFRIKHYQKKSSPITGEALSIRFPTRR
jgi:hypothetical protein